MQSTEPTTSKPTRRVPGRPLRPAFGGLAVLFVAGVVTQVFLAGLGVLVDPAYFGWHTTFAHILEGIMLVMLVTGALGRIGWPGLGLTVLLFVTFATQYVFIHALSGPGRALHLVSAFVLFLLGLSLAKRGFSQHRPSESLTVATVARQQRANASLLAAIAVVAMVALTLVGVMAGGATATEVGMENATQPSVTAGDESAAGNAAGGSAQPDGADDAAGGAAAALGASVFRANCAGCHGPDGGGAVGPGIMPAFGGRLSDEQIAAVTAHVRSSWGNDFAAAPR